MNTTRLIENNTNNTTPIAQEYHSYLSLAWAGIYMATALQGHDCVLNRLVNDDTQPSCTIAIRISFVTTEIFVKMVWLSLDLLCSCLQQ